MNGREMMRRRAMRASLGADARNGAPTTEEASPVAATAPRMMRRLDAVPTEPLAAPVEASADPAPDAAGFDDPAPSPSPSPLRDQAVPADAAPGSGKVLAVYLLHLAGFLTSNLTNVIAVILAYAFRDGADPTTRSHLRNGATIFWGALVFNLVAFGLAGGGFVRALGVAALMDLGMTFDALDPGTLIAGPVAVSLFVGGILLGLYAFVWFLVRTIKGLVLLNERKAYPNPDGWGF